MPDIIKLSELEELTELADGDEFVVRDVSEPLAVDQTKKIKASNLTLNVATVINAVYPVGSIYTSVVSTNPATLFGVGTWAAFGAGRVLVGRDASQTEFDTVEETGGAKTHTLTSSEMPSHTHTQNSHTHTTPSVGDLRRLQHLPSGGDGIWTRTDNSPLATSNATTATNQNTGGGAAHNNLQPYVVVFFFKRTS
jgi:microcystin-dependent protein